MKQSGLLFFCILLISGCSTLPKETGKVRDQGDAEVLKIRAEMTVAPHSSIKSVDSGKRLQEYDILPNGFENNIVLQIKHEYYYKNSTYQCEFELVYSGVILNGSILEAKKGQEIGESAGEKIFLSARSKKLDPYLIACSNIAPIKSGNYWYFSPGMYIPTMMKWLSFKPADYNEFKSMYDHATTGEESLGLTLFNWWTLYRTELSEFPKIVTRNGKESIEQVIYFKDLPLHLIYQKGFLDYLKEEYKIGDRIYLYLQISGIDGFSKEFNCYVRDFSLKSPEEIIEERIDHLNEQKKEVLQSI